MILFLILNISIIQQRIKPALQQVVSMPHYLLPVSTKKDYWSQNTPETMCFSLGWHYNKEPDRISVTALMYFSNVDVHSFTRNARLPLSFNYAQQSKTICILRLQLLTWMIWRCKYACVWLWECLCTLISCYSSNSFASAPLSACGFVMKLNTHSHHSQL